jgi:hypothetical protein
MVKNINSTHRADGIKSQFALSGARAAAASKFDIGAWASKNNVKLATDLTGPL